MALINPLSLFVGEKIGLDCNLKNSTHALFKKITMSDTCTRRCGLVWRLYLQFLHEHFEPKTCRDAYYQAVEECPWLKVSKKKKNKESIRSFAMATVKDLTICFSSGIVYGRCRLRAD